MHIKSIIFSFLIILLSACHNKVDNDVELVYLNGSVVDTGDDASFFKLVFASDSLIVVSSFSNSYKLTSYHKCGSTYREENFLNIGNGPQEVQMASVKYFHDSIRVVSYSPFGITGLLSMPLNSLTDSDTWNHIPVKQELLYGGDFAWDIDGSVVLIAGEMDSEEILTRFRTADGGLSKIDFWPEDSYKGSSVTKQMMYFRSSSLSANGEKIMFAAGEGRYVSILDMSTSPITEKKLFAEYPRYKTARDGINPVREPGSPLGVYSFSTENAIYLSPVNCHINNHGKYDPEDYKGYPAYYVDVLDVFDWDGTHLKTLLFDRPFSDFHVNEEEHCIYTHSCDLESMSSVIYKYLF